MSDWSPRNLWLYLKESDSNYIRNQWVFKWHSLQKTITEAPQGKLILINVARLAAANPIEVWAAAEFSDCGLTAVRDVGQCHSNVEFPTFGSEVAI